ncbi:hypothetical protein LPW11_17670 [Geomonas sp. RF6]|uniref:hypothetical protein n=1 Tax=Geomonas sp. RF6 TaxID=2897342 RepID=UPI001E40375E|nr:hypothetical protein [Geomonas sp. RF6]UFS69711.1 hypothetical protein LPW11_17670 [Geomonas sp. RF6]
MKKILAVAALLACAAGTSYAVTNGWGYGTAGTYTFGATAATQLAFKPSANVGMSYDTDSGGTVYTVGAYHAQGNKAYATSSVDTNVYYTDITAPGINVALSTPAAPTKPTSATASTAFGAGWTASK